MTNEVRTRFDLEPEPGDDLGPEYVANLVANALRRALTDAALVPTEGLTVHVQPRGAKVHAATEVAAWHRALEGRGGRLTRALVERPPVSEGGRLVGVLSRSGLQRRLAEDEPPPEPERELS